MAKDHIKSFINRSSFEVKANQNVNSDCTEITFVNQGDTPVIIGFTDSQGGWKLNENDSLTFGSDRSDLQETTNFSINFDSIGTIKKVLVSKSFIVPHFNC